MSESKWKQIVGKKISEGAYINADSLREDYLKAMPNIAISTNGNIKKELEENKIGLETQARIIANQREEIEILKQLLEKFEREQKEVGEHYLVRSPIMEREAEERGKWLAEQMQQLNKRLEQLETKKNRKKKAKLEGKKRS